MQIQGNIIPDILNLTIGRATETIYCCIYKPNNQVLKIQTSNYKIEKCQEFLHGQSVFQLFSAKFELSVIELPSISEIGKILQAPSKPDRLDDTSIFSDCFERDLENQISELNMGEFGITARSNFSQYTEINQDGPGFPEAESELNDLES